MGSVSKKSACLVALLIIAVQFSFTTTRLTGPPDLAAAKNYDTSANTGIIKTSPKKCAKLYDSLGLKVAGLSRQAFDYAVKGYGYLLDQGKVRNDGVLSIIDFTLPSSYKRLFVIDLKACSVLFNTYVAHGRNSGGAVASTFSNDMNSFKSSLGFYITSGTYKGKHGYSLKLEGEERGINDNALSRGIVMHCAPYVSESFIKSRGYIGRSEGCPAVSSKVYKPIIEKIKDGSCLFMYSSAPYYIGHSDILKIGGAA